MKQFTMLLAVLATAIAFASAPADAAVEKAPAAKVQKVGKFSAGRCREAVRAAGIRSGPAGLAALQRCIRNGPGAI